MEYVFFFGTHPDLSWAELTRVLARDGLSFALQARSPRVVVLSVARELPRHFIDQLGGTIRIGRVLARQLTPWTAGGVLAVCSLVARKFSIGLSILSPGGLRAAELGRELKRQLKKSGYTMKFILPQTAGQPLNAAQVLFHRLTEAPNAELVFFRLHGEFWLATTTQIQDIRLYTQRDRERPYRDAARGMLPPKVAQMMLNLAPGTGSSPPRVLDPFCGTGTLVLEGMLLGWTMIGSDKREVMVQATRANAQWLQQAFPRLARLQPRCFVHDVHRPFPSFLHGQCTAVVTEPYLGRALRSPLPRRALLTQQRELAALYTSFFAHARALFAGEGRIVLALPVVRQRGSHGDLAMPQSFLDGVARLGYCLERLSSTARGTLMYSRPRALVGREITLWLIKKQEAQHG